MSFVRCVIMLVIITSCYSCKMDSPFGSRVSEIESAYFADYVSPKHKWGFINTQGQIAVSPKYDDAKDVWDDLIAVNYKGKWGYITVGGEEQIESQYKQAYNFSSSRAFVQDFDNRWLLIDKKGAVLDTMPYLSMRDFQGDFAVIGNGTSNGIIDRDGATVIPVSYESMVIIDNQRFIAKSGGSYGIISKDNKVLLPFKYDRIYPPSQGVIRVKSNKKYQFLNSNTFDPLGQDYYKKAFDFYMPNGTIVKGGRYQLIDKDLKVLKEIKADKIEYAGDNKWSYKYNGLWGLLDAQGEKLTEPKYELLNRYSDGMIAFSINEKWGYLNELGQEQLPAKYVLAWDYNNGLARIIDKRGVGFIDKQGQLIVDDKFIEVRDFKAGVARFQTY